MSSPFRLMFTSTGGELATQLILLARQSRKHEIQVVAADMQSEIPARRVADAFVRLPAGTDSGYADAALQAVRDHGVRLIVPGSDEEALALSFASDRFLREGCQIAAAPFEKLKVVANKAAAYEALAAAGMTLPRWTMVASREELAQALRQICAETGGAVVKPVADRGSRGVFVLKNAVGEGPGSGAREIWTTLQAFLEGPYASYDRFPAIVMERLEEPVHDVDLLAWNGVPQRIVPRRRLASAMPNAGHLYIDSPELKRLGETVIRTLGLTWLYDCDVMFTKEGEPRLLEVNPRPSGGWSVTVTAGVPLIDDLVSLAKGEPLAEVEDPAGRVVIPYQALVRIA